MPTTSQAPKLLDDPYLEPFIGALQGRREYADQLMARLLENCPDLPEFASGHEHFGLHRCDGGWVFREWAPNATSIHLIGTFSDWNRDESLALHRVNEPGVWEIRLPEEALHHGDLYRLHMSWPGGEGDRIPAWARRVVQDDHSKIFNAQVWCPPEPYMWRNDCPARPAFPLVYESHVGIAQEREGVGTYVEFGRDILPRIADAGYNTVQLMALMEHPYYGSFGYHVSSFFAASSRFGTPEELKALIDKAHGAGLCVIMDLVHSHSVKNEVEGLSRFDGTEYQYFHEGGKGDHPAWDSRCFDYAKPEVLHFLLSNCRYWIDEFHVDGFRFDGITSMLYHHHGLGDAFTNYEQYFDDSIDEEALAYLTLANTLIHDIKPSAMTVAEDVSGMPGLAAPIEDCGYGFDYRLAMGVPDCWFKLANDIRDEDWSLDWLWHELTNRRVDEKTLSYVECHDQALVGGKTMFFELADAAIYHHMQAHDNNPVVDRAMALHKMMRLATLASAGHGYLNFMGNEFGHPEWIDFPREGNGWSHKYARRQWSLRDSADLKYHFLADFDRDLLRFQAEHLDGPPVRPRLLRIDAAAKILAFERRGALFLLNFHTEASASDYRIEVPAGEYALALDTDATVYGGHARIQAGQRFHTQPIEEGDTIRQCIHVYLPCRTALALAPVIAGKS